MPNPNPHKARQAKKAKQRAGTIQDVQEKVWTAILTAEQVLTKEGADDTLRLRAVHAITQAAASYVKITETGELEARLAELEKAIERKSTNGQLRKVG